MVHPKATGLNVLCVIDPGSVQLLRKLLLIVRH